MLAVMLVTAVKAIRVYKVRFHRRSVTKKRKRNRQIEILEHMADRVKGISLMTESLVMAMLSPRDKSAVSCPTPYWTEAKQRPADTMASIYDEFASDVRRKCDKLGRLTSAHITKKSSQPRHRTIRALT